MTTVMSTDINLPDNGREVSPSELHSASSHRRVELQSIADLIYLKNNVAHAARAKIDLHLPLEAALREGNTGVDAMRRAVEAGVDKYIEETFGAAKMGISVNGIDAEKIEWEKEVPEEFEPFDTRLASRISNLYSQIETLNLELANRRRTAAQAVAQNFREGFEAHSAKQEAAIALQDTEDARDSANMEAIRQLQVPVGWLGRQDDIRRTWATTLDTLGRLPADISQAKYRGEKAKEVLDYTEGRQ